MSCRESYRDNRKSDFNLHTSRSVLCCLLPRFLTPSQRSSYSFPRHLREKCSTGFTLIELMIVVAILGILSVSSIMCYVIAMDKARAASCEMTLDALRKGLEGFHAEYTGYPDDEDIDTIHDMRAALRDFVSFSGNSICCDEEIEYTSTRSTYRIEAEVHFGNGDGDLGMKYIVENAEIRKQPL